jgi:hypothetical protein
MKKYTCCFLLLLTGCIPHWADYQPKLATPPKDNVRYESDRKMCLADADKRSMKADPLADADAWTNPHSMVDRCMAAKGYDVIKVSHCC